MYRHKHGDGQIERTKKYDSNERTEQNTTKDVHETEIADLSEAQFKTLVISHTK